jgi:hypothetical protein
MKILLALIGVSPGILAAYYANKAARLGVTNRDGIAKVAQQTDGVTEKLVAVEKKLSFKKGVVAGKAAKKDTK